MSRNLSRGESFDFRRVSSLPGRWRPQYAPKRKSDERKPFAEARCRSEAGAPRDRAGASRRLPLGAGRGAWRRVGRLGYDTVGFFGEASEWADPDVLKRATELWQEAYRYQMAGDLERAIETYQRSIEVQPTAEAHTYLGWTYSFQNRIEAATAECLKAIAIDPEFGNPYNDIGVYLMQQGRLDEAIPWLEKAKGARRYEPRHFPYLNLGRIHLKQGKWWEALREFEGAVRLAPRDAEARKALHTLRGQLN